MSPKHRSIALFVVSLGLLSIAWLVPHRAPPAAPLPVLPSAQAEPPRHLLTAQPQGEAPLVQIALLLDTSGSMEGLIDQARRQLWQIVMDVSRARRDGVPARLQIALFEYGNAGLSGRSHWVRRILPFTEEVDRVSEELFGLVTSGGSEYCGAAMKSALDSLEWSRDPSAVKLMFIAGNESFDQGPIRPWPVVQTAQALGITVNTIMCGSEGPNADGWRKGAALASGHFFTLDHNRAVVELDAPQDEEIARLGSQLNETTLPYGALGASGSSRQRAQDRNASGLSRANMSTRVASRASGLYVNPSWDLVDAVDRGTVDVEQLDEEALPAKMRGLSAAGRVEYVRAQKARRAEINARIRALQAARQSFLTEARAQRNLADDDIDGAIIAAVRARASKAGLSFE